MKITLRILKWLALSILGLVLLVFLLLAFENGAQSVELSASDKKAIQAPKAYDPTVAASC